MADSIQKNIENVVARFGYASGMRLGSLKKREINK